MWILCVTMGMWSHAEVFHRQARTMFQISTASIETADQTPTD